MESPLFAAVKQTFVHEEFRDKNLQLINVGAERVVFKVEGVPGRVFKVPVAELGDRVFLSAAGKNGDSKECDRIIIEQQMEDWRDEQELEKEAKSVFGEKHFLERSIFRVTIPVTKEFAIRHFEEKPPTGILNHLPDDYREEVRILAESQEEFDVITNPDKYFNIPFGIRLVDRKDFFRADIEEGTRQVREMVDKQYRLMKDFIEDSESGPVLRDLVEKMIIYTKKTGRMIDVFGSHNIVVFANMENQAPDEDVKDFDYKIIEFSMPWHKDHWTATFAEEQATDKYDCLRHYYSYYYFLNKLGKEMGIEDGLKPGDLSYFKK